MTQLESAPRTLIAPKRARRSEGARSPLQIAAPLGVPIMALILIVVFSFRSSAFLTGTNIQNIFADSALPVMVALGLTLVLVMGEFDLSIAATAGITTMLFAVFVSPLHNMSPALAIVLTLLIGLGIGLFNGVVVAYVGINALVVTIPT